MTPLDKAYIEAIQSKKESIFYDAFLSATIFVPTINVPEIEQEKRAGEHDSIAPIVIEADETRYLMLFDTKERLASWAQREVGFAALPGHAIVEMTGTDFHWALNAGTEHMKTFVPDEIKWLKENLQRGTDFSVAAGTRVLIGSPAIIPTGLLKTLKHN